MILTSINVRNISIVVNGTSLNIRLIAHLLKCVGFDEDQLLHLGSDKTIACTRMQELHRRKAMLRRSTRCRHAENLDSDMIQEHKRTLLADCLFRFTLRHMIISLASTGYCNAGHGETS
jgi:hypothetical protein